MILQVFLLFLPVRAGGAQFYRVDFKRISLDDIVYSGMNQVSNKY